MWRVYGRDKKFSERRIVVSRLSSISHIPHFKSTTFNQKTRREVQRRIDRANGPREALKIMKETIAFIKVHVNLDLMR